MSTNLQHVAVLQGHALGVQHTRFAELLGASFHASVKPRESIRRWRVSFARGFYLRALEVCECELQLLDAQEALSEKDSAEDDSRRCFESADKPVWWCRAPVCTAACVSGPDSAKPARSKIACNTWKRGTQSVEEHARSLRCLVAAYPVSGPDIASRLQGTLGLGW